MEKASKELLRDFVNSQHFTSTTEILNSMKELFGNDNSNMVKLDNAIGELKEAIPQSTTSDVGKFVCINSEGKMSLVSIPRAEGGSF